MNKKNCLFGFLFFLIFAVLSAQEKIFPPKALLNASYKGELATIKEILKTNPPKDVRDEYGATALHDAMFQENAEVIKLLIEYGYDVNDIGPRNGYTPLHYAVWADNAAAARLLLTHGANKNIKGKDGLTPLAKARKESKRELVLILSAK
jgi:ankyrin repeat protein